MRCPFRQPITIETHGGIYYGSTTQSQGNERQQNVGHHTGNVIQISRKAVVRIQGEPCGGRRGRSLHLREDAQADPGPVPGFPERGGRHQRSADSRGRAHRSTRYAAAHERTCDQSVKRYQCTLGPPDDPGRSHTAPHRDRPCIRDDKVQRNVSAQRGYGQGDQVSERKGCRS